MKAPPALASPLTACSGESTSSGAPAVLQVERAGRLRLVNLHRAYGPDPSRPGKNPHQTYFDVIVLDYTSVC